MNDSERELFECRGATIKEQAAEIERLKDLNTELATALSKRLPLVRVGVEALDADFDLLEKAGFVVKRTQGAGEGGDQKMSELTIGWRTNDEQIVVNRLNAEIKRLNAENQQLKATLETLIKEVAAAYMKALGPVEPASDAAKDKGDSESARTSGQKIISTAVWVNRKKA